MIASSFRATSNLSLNQRAATPAGCPIRTLLDPFDVGQIQFFTNAIDTETTGVDFVALYDWQVER